MPPRPLNPPPIVEDDVQSTSSASSSWVQADVVGVIGTHQQQLPPLVEVEDPGAFATQQPDHDEVCHPNFIWLQNYNLQHQEGTSLEDVRILMNQLNVVFETLTGLLQANGPIRYMIATTLKMLIAMLINLQPSTFEQPKHEQPPDLL